MTADIDVPWTADAGVLFRQRVLLRMGAGDDDAVEIASSLMDGPAEVGAAIADLQDLDLAGNPPRKSGTLHPHQALITRNGRSLISSWAGKRSPVEVENACFAAMLAWLFAQRSHTVSSTFDLSRDVRGHYYGVPFEDATLTQVGRALLKMGLITGTGTAQGPVLRPAITLDGQVVHTQYGGDLLAWHASKSSAGTTFNIQNSTGVAVAHQSPGASQVVTVGGKVADQVRLLAGALDRLRTELEPLDLARAAGVAEQLERALQDPVPDTGNIKALLNAARDIGVNASGSVAGAGIVALSQHILHLLGG